MKIQAPANPWRSRGYLPHFDQSGLVQGVTFRLADSLPQSFLRECKEQLARLPRDGRNSEKRKLIASYLDRGIGNCYLKNTQIAELVSHALRHFDGTRYSLLAWCIMPNHVHVILETKEESPLDVVVHTWKSFTAKKANRILGRTGRFWQRDYHDRYIRNEKHLLQAILYVENNPVSARLVERAEDWPWSSASTR